MLCCVGQKKNIWLAIPIYAVAIFMPLYIRYIHIADTQSPLFSFLKLAMGIVVLMALYVFGVAVYDNKKLSVTDAAVVYSACLYTIAAFTAMVYLRYYIDLGKYVYLLTFLCAWITDSFAYFTGRLFGKHKLIPSVSPKKTVEGAIGGVVFCVITIVVFGLVIDRFFDPSDNFRAMYIPLAVSGVVVSVVSQTGDLIMSVIKRHYSIKDYGKILPGHGGILDRFDSVMAVSLVLVVICTYFNLFS
jgi:phosphatidate cytidylyltransferase